MRKVLPFLLQLALVVACATAPLDMYWWPNPEGDMDKYEVWRNLGTGYELVDDAVPHVPVQVETAPGVFEERILWEDSTIAPGQVGAYKGVAVDDCGNRSGFSVESV